MTLHNVTVLLNTNGWKVQDNPIEVNQKGTTYWFYVSVTRGNKVIKKSSLMKIDTKFNQRHDFYAYYTWCLPEDVDNARIMLINKISEDFEKVAKEFYIIRDFSLNTGTILEAQKFSE